MSQAVELWRRAGLREIDGIVSMPQASFQRTWAINKPVADLSHFLITHIFHTREKLFLPLEWPICQRGTECCTLKIYRWTLVQNTVTWEHSFRGKHSENMQRQEWWCPSVNCQHAETVSRMAEMTKQSNSDHYNRQDVTICSKWKYHYMYALKISIGNIQPCIMQHRISLV